MTSPSIHLLLIDPDPTTASLLVQDMEGRGLGQVTRVANTSELAGTLEHGAPDVVVFNYHFHLPSTLQSCVDVKQLAPYASLLAIASIGPAAKAIRQWDRQADALDALIEKPFPKEKFFAILEDLVNTQRTIKTTKTKVRQLSNLLPEYAVSVADRNDAAEVGEVEMFEAAVVFTDIRRSSEIITQMPPREFFKLLNQSLSSQATHIREFEGSVIKYTGDGLMAIFRGMGRSHLAVRCALALAESSGQQIFSYGIGVAGGLVLAGLVGDSTRSGHKRQYDVIGATVHLASRLCSMAGAGQVMTTKTMYASARFSHPSQRPIGPVSIRGFATDVDCVTFSPTTHLTGSRL